MGVCAKGRTGVVIACDGGLASAGVVPAVTGVLQEKKLCGGEHAKSEMRCARWFACITCRENGARDESCEISTHLDMERCATSGFGVLGGIVAVTPDKATNDKRTRDEAHNEKRLSYVFKFFK